MTFGMVFIARKMRALLYYFSMYFLRWQTNHHDGLKQEGWRVNKVSVPNLVEGDNNYTWFLKCFALASLSSSSLSSMFVCPLVLHIVLLEVEVLMASMM